jgi:hypothetical protein
LVIPPDIRGEFTIVRSFDREPISVIPMKQRPATHLRHIINKDIEAIIIPAPNHSLDSDIDGGEFTVTEEEEDSDYVSTLRDPNEEQ